MNRFIFSIIFLIPCVYGSPFLNPSNVDPSCLPELNNTSAELEQCFNLERFNKTAIQNEVMTTLISYSGDEIALREFSVKYCNLGYELIDCLPIYFNITPLCQPVDTELAHSIVRSVKKSWDFTCDNNAEAFVQMVINNGMQIMKDNYLSISECGRRMNSLNGLTNLNNLHELLPEVCEKFKEVLACHNEWMETRANSQFINYINGTYTITIEELGC